MVFACQVKFSRSEKAPLLALQKFSEKEWQIVQKKLKQKEKEDEKKSFILCKACKNKITSAEESIQINGSHEHSFKNPSGIVFNIGCFASAEGCVNHGQSTGVFTWFNGFSWRFALCSACHTHLGWFYQSKEGNSFYGLILANLIEGLP